jgi:hypothetical protein
VSAGVISILHSGQVSGLVLVRSGCIGQAYCVHSFSRVSNPPLGALLQEEKTMNKNAETKKNFIS